MFVTFDPTWLSLNAKPTEEKEPANKNLASIFLAMLFFTFATLYVATCRWWIIAFTLHMAVIPDMEELGRKMVRKSVAWASIYRTRYI